jgi:hypothetical protein
VFSLEATRSVEPPTEVAPQVAELKRGSELHASVTSDAVPSLVAEPTANESCSRPSTNLNTGMTSYQSITGPEISSSSDRVEF